MASWVHEVFIEKAELFGAVMEAFWERGRKEAEGIARVFEKHGISKGSRVLELGCGIGRVAIHLARLGYGVVCLDISEPYIAKARERASREGVGGFEAVVGDAYRVDEVLAGRAFDAVYMVWSTLLGYGSREDDLVLFERAARVTRPGGLLVVANTVSRDLVVQRELCKCPRPVLSEYGDLVVIEHSEFDSAKSLIKSKWVFYRRHGKNLVYVDEIRFTLRAYTLTELVELAEGAGWKFEAAYHSLETLEPPRPEGSPINAVFRKPLGS
ncbi:MAG: class I SAM-dependent methyltransferase [Desulfurococcaceae archaeon]